MVTDSDVDQQYSALRPTLERCKQEVHAILVGLIGSMGAGQLIRAHLSEPRIKSLASVKAKITRQSLSGPNPLDQIDDLVGFRVVCNNLEDLPRIRDLILSSSRFKLKSEQDYVKNPQPSGYRALHLTVVFEVTGPTVTPVTCEIQIRTLAQDMWAELAHYDLYKHDDVMPGHIVTSSQRISQLLSLADQHAQDIREQVARPLVGIPGEQLEPGPLAFIYKRVFGSDPPDYLVRYVLNRCQEVGCFRLDAIDRALGDDEAISKLRAAYEEASGWAADDEYVFELCPELAVLGLEETIEGAAQLGREHRAEVDSIARSEVLSELPDTFAEFTQDMPSLDYDLADVMDALGECSICGAPIVDVDALVEGILEQYGEDEDVDNRIAMAVWDSGIETGDEGDSSLCSYHGYILSKEC